MKAATKLFKVVLLALLLASCGGGKRTSSVILISIDTLRPDHLSCYGYKAKAPTSPTLDRLAREGALFKNALSTTSWTLPAHMALLTSLFDCVHGVKKDEFCLDENRITLAEAFQRAGYRTAAFVSGPYLNPAFGFQQGFNEYFDLTSYPYPSLDDLEEDNFKKVEAIFKEIQKANLKSHRDVTSPRVYEKSTAWLEQNHKEPFFLFLHFFDVHYDFVAPKEYVDLFDPDYTGKLTGDQFMGNQSIEPGMDPRDYQRLMALYDAEIRFTDDFIGKILDRVRDLGIEDSTAVVVTADHGEEFLDHGKKGHRHTLYEELLRIPLVFRIPWLEKRGLRIKDPVRIIDVMPTLVELFGLDAGKEMMGRSLVPYLKGEETQPPPLHMGELVDKMVSVQSDFWKIVFEPKTKISRFFDLKSDPKEQNPIRPEDFPEGEKKKLEAFDFYEKAKDFRKTLKEVKTKRVEFTDELREKLKALGYLNQ